MAAVPSPSPQVASSSGAILAFIQLDTDSPGSSSGRLVVYDLNQKKTITQNPVPQEKDVFPSLGSWSADGNYIPFLLTREITQPHPLYLYDLKTNSAKKLLDINQNEALKDSSASFNYHNAWVDSQKFLLTSDQTRNYLVDLQGTVSSEPISTSTSEGNNSISLYYFRPLSLAQATSAAMLTYSKIVVNGQQIPFSPTGRVIGFTNNQLITLETPQLPSYNMTENSDLDKQFKAAKTEAEKQAIVIKSLTPTGPSKLHFYSLQGQEQPSFDLNSSGWVVIDAKPRPAHNSLVILERQGFQSTAPARLLEVSLSPSPTIRPIADVSAGIQDGGGLITSAGGFGISQDGAWIVASVVVTYTADSQSQSNITAWNIDSGTAMQLCQSKCGEYEVYNPDQITLR